MTNAQLPKEWITTNLESIISISSGKSLPKNKMMEGSIPVFGGNGITGMHDDANVYESTIVIGRVGFYCGSVHLTSNKAWVTDNAFITAFNDKYLDKNFLHKLLVATNLRDDDSSTAQPVISGRKVYPIKVNLPPLPEQKIIAEKLDSLLAQVESTKARLESIPAILKQLRQSVLAAAVSGELTEDWRDNSQKKWSEYLLDDLILDSTNGLAKRKGLVGEDVTILRLADFKDSKRVFGNERKIMLSEKEVKKYQLKSGDILVIRVNGSIEIAGRFIEYMSSDKIEGFCDHFIRIRLNSNKILPRFLTIIANEGEGRHYLQNSLSTSAGQNTINQTSVKKLQVLLPPVGEQEEIVRRVEALFGFVDKVEVQVKTALESVNHLTQSILAQAFSGELTKDWREQNPDLISGENSAAALLERIKAERAKLKPAQQPRELTKKATKS